MVHGKTMRVKEGEENKEIINSHSQHCIGVPFALIILWFVPSQLPELNTGCDCSVGMAALTGEVILDCLSNF